MKPYQHEFYKSRHRETRTAAAIILSILLERLPHPASAVDIGCGVGTWLAVLQEKGVDTIQGVDGSWIDPRLLAIPPDCFKQVDLSAADPRLPRKYDLAISLEVAEHLPAERAAGFVAALTDLADCVLFSAAIPYQRGRNHINEQWQEYWARLFAERSYRVHDFIRPAIWNDTRIPFWYRQNILLFSKDSTIAAACADPAAGNPQRLPLNVVHPELYINRAKPQFDFKAKIAKYYKKLTARSV